MLKWLRKIFCKWKINVNISFNYLHHIFLFCVVPWNFNWVINRWLWNHGMSNSIPNRFQLWKSILFNLQFDVFSSLIIYFLKCISNVACKKTRLFPRNFSRMQRYFIYVSLFVTSWSRHCLLILFKNV